MKFWARRVAILLVVWGILVGHSFLAERHAHLLLLLAAVFVVAVAIWVTTDVFGLLSPIDWRPPHRFRWRYGGFDARFSRLSQQLTESSDRQAVAQEVHASLSRVAEDILRSKYGVNPATEPQAAAEILGPDLTDYLNTPPRYRRGRFLQHITDLLDRLETL